MEVWALAWSLKCQRSQGGGGDRAGGLSPSTVDLDAHRHPLHNTTVFARRAPGLVALLWLHKRQDHHNGGKRGTSVEGGHVQVSCPHVSIKCHSSKLGYGLGANRAKPCLWWVVHCRHPRCKMHSCICAICSSWSGPSVFLWALPVQNCDASVG